jgi:hypothetical protein
MSQLSFSIDGELAKLVLHSGHALALPIPGSVPAARSPFPRFIEAWRSSIFLEVQTREKRNAVK